MAKEMTTTGNTGGLPLVEWHAMMAAMWNAMAANMIRTAHHSVHGQSHNMLVQRVASIAQSQASRVDILNGNRQDDMNKIKELEEMIEVLKLDQK